MVAALTAPDRPSHFTVGFTGVARTLAPREEDYIAQCLEGLHPPGEFVSGAAYGVDTAAALIALELYPLSKHTLFVPAAPHNEALVAYFKGKGQAVRRVMEGRSRSASYMLRNEAIVNSCHLLIAFPETTAEVVRSGTWSTVRRARKAKVPVELHPLSAA